MEENRKYGGVIDYERPTDWAKGTIPFDDRCADFTSSLPVGEKQRLLFDNMSCTDYSALNSVETQVHFLLSQINQEGIKRLQELGFLKDGQFNSSDRFTAVVSGTTDQGNSCVNVWDSIRKHTDGSGFGLLPESDVPFTATMTKAQYYKRDFTPEQLAKAKLIWEIFDFEYENVLANNVTALAEWEIEDLRRHLRQAPLQITSPVCHWNDPLITPCGKVASEHATMLFKIEKENGKWVFYIFDSYSPYIKKLSADYIIRYAYKGVVTINPKYKKSMTTAKLLKNTKNENELSINLALDDPATMANILPKFGINVPKLADGSIDWANVKIDGIYTINQ